MQPRPFLFTLTVLAPLYFSTASGRSQTTITFDDISNSGLSNGLPSNEAIVTNGYQGLNWVNFYTLNAPLIPKQNGILGYNYGMVTASNVAVNGGGSLAEIDAINTNFNFLSAHLTGAFNSNLNIEVQGFNGINLLYDTTVMASATNATLFTFNYLDIDRLTFNSFGGQAAFSDASEQFAMDNLTVEFVPEPSSLLLTGLAALFLWPSSNATARSNRSVNRHFS